MCHCIIASEPRLGWTGLAAPSSSLVLSVSVIDEAVAQLASLSTLEASLASAIRSAGEGGRFGGIQRWLEAISKTAACNRSRLQRRPSQLQLPAPALQASHAGGHRLHLYCTSAELHLSSHGPAGAPGEPLGIFLEARRSILRLTLVASLANPLPLPYNTTPMTTMLGAWPLL
ncbi:hypothetical protein FZEAL_10524 [Fusarium zealandicum]|uniref:Uncharacterized protein n=1 Tax=Fusarium zealandicum TaxID=1053134 RepID=A0A8H4U0I8_9HYPO|nr:hypothetical protein FZEAL_10524 [Fusarium zealandicum]